MLHKRQLVEAKIRIEELEAEQVQKINEEDRKRADLIVERFITESEMVRRGRMGGRLLYLNWLEEKRMVMLADEE